MPAMKWQLLRQILSLQARKSKQNKTTLSFGRLIHAGAVATLVREGALDPKVQGSNPGASRGDHLYNNDQDRPSGELNMYGGDM